MPLIQIARFIATLHVGAIALAMFHDHFIDHPSRRQTRAQHAAMQEKNTSQQTRIHSWRCPQCDHENRALRSTNQRSQTPECAKCHDDVIVARCAPRKTAHRELLDNRPIQVSHSRVTMRRVLTVFMSLRYERLIGSETIHFRRISPFN